MWRLFSSKKPRDPGTFRMEIQYFFHSRKYSIFSTQENTVIFTRENRTIDTVRPRTTVYLLWLIHARPRQNVYPCLVNLSPQFPRMGISSTGFRKDRSFPRISNCWNPWLEPCKKCLNRPVFVMNFQSFKKFGFLGLKTYETVVRKWVQFKGTLMWQDRSVPKGIVYQYRVVSTMPLYCTTSALYTQFSYVVSTNQSVGCNSVMWCRPITSRVGV